ncbi:S-adenosyl-L-methionine-dependent methyltransferase [Tuber magnatum]|uniref:S-adenosyl-L-methionine-dependent methyltransferase n=1 Tax=Tuber magnatum TaxID=42249 RepID=A0A317SLN8_9PEZI|nr:S-adenosyl-L-methionine-dependent methyltransferase [Tuber magnatum]
MAITTASRPPAKDMRAMAKRAQASRNSPAAPIALGFPKLLAVFKAVVLLSTASIMSYASQIALAPVYGGIPTSLYHSKISAFVFAAAWVAKYLPFKLPFRARNLLPILSLYVPMAQRALAKYSSSWGPFWGPIITEGVTFYPLLFLTVYSAAHLANFRNPVTDGVLAGLFAGYFWNMRSLVSKHLVNRIGSSWILTRCGLPNLAGGIYALVSPSLLLLTAIPATFHTNMYNSMCTSTAGLDETLSASNYTLLARQESNTGYISVLQNNHQNFRVLRCDHSLLGGVWERPPPGFEYRGQGVNEPIYAVFVMLEAVRLVDPPPKNPNPKALAIGLGIGTAVSGLIAHGVETDVVELDPVVHRYATEFFQLGENHTAYIEDAITFVKRERSNKGKDRKKYEYILHDVFTGGAVPASLFTLEFFVGLRDLLSEDGVIAINWAGDLKLMAAKSIVETVRTVFNGCRVFREDMPEEDIGKATVDYSNMVIFCTRSSDPYTFRAPADADILGSITRKHYLFPQFEMNLDQYFGVSGGFTLLSESNIDTLIGWQETSALGHWVIIRTVMPPVVWENY